MTTVLKHISRQPYTMTTILQKYLLYINDHICLTGEDKYVPESIVKPGGLLQEDYLRYNNPLS